MEAMVMPGSDATKAAGDGPPFNEMAECRTTIGRVDGSLEDLRKYGFSLITTLLTASGIAAGVTHTGSILPVAAATIIFLVLVLFGLDMYYFVVLSGAVERSMDLEIASPKPYVRITTTISGYATSTHSVSAVFAMYSVFVGVAAYVGFIGGDMTARITLPIVAFVVWGLMLGYWLFVRATTHLHLTRIRAHPPFLKPGWNAVEVTGSGFTPGTKVAKVFPEIPKATFQISPDMSSTSLRLGVTLPAGEMLPSELEITFDPTGNKSNETIRLTVVKDPS
jgi:hypothetical protein